MHILHVSWEYPPLVYGGLGRHVGALALAQARAGHDVTVVTQTEGDPADDVIEGVRVVRYPRRPGDLEFRADTMLAWVKGLDHALDQGIVRLAGSAPVDVIHGHDWMVTTAVATAQRSWQVPVVATLHATEAGRHQGWLPNALSREVHAREWELAHRATRVISCSAHMGWEVHRLFDVPQNRVDVIPNGIDQREWQIDADARHVARATYAGTDPLIVFAGRLEWEKGVHTLIEAMPLLHRTMPDARLVIAGKGGREAELIEAARVTGVGDRIRFTGWLPEGDLHALVAAADVAVVPSLYEPFGLVALEAAALDTPIVVARTGGLAEIADGDRVALTFTADDPADLAAVLSQALSDPVAAAGRASHARQALTRIYDWNLVAARTVGSYESAVASFDGAPDVPPAPTPPSGNLLVATS